MRVRMCSMCVHVQIINFIPAIVTSYKKAHTCLTAYYIARHDATECTYCKLKSVTVVEDCRAKMVVTE